MPVELHVEMWEGSCWIGESGFRDKVLAGNLKLSSSTCGGNLSCESLREWRGIEKRKGPNRALGTPVFKGLEMRKNQQRQLKEAIPGFEGGAGGRGMPPLSSHFHSRVFLELGDDPDAD